MEYPLLEVEKVETKGRQFKMQKKKKKKPLDNSQTLGNPILKKNPLHVTKMSC
jgi:hypothetical protein